MSKDTGIFQLPNGNYGFRIVIKRKDLKIDTTFRQDENGNPYKTKASARDARERKLYELKNKPINPEEKIKKYKLKDIYKLYIENGSSSKAYATVKKQESMWKNHIKDNFGEKYINEITLNDLQNYLSQLYNYGDDYSNTPYSYKYVEGFLKFFYLLFGYAYKENAINTDTYTKMFLDRSTRLTMPPITQEDYEEYEDLKIYSKYELKLMGEVLKRGHFYLPFLLGYNCGLRISECFGLQIEDIDVLDNKITVNKQLLYQDGIWCLCPVKTLKSSRTIYISQEFSDILREHIFQLLERQSTNPGYRNYEIIVDKTKKEHKKIQGANFLLRKDNGELLTNNSIKYWQRVIKEELNIEFKYHSLRKSVLTYLASENTPLYELMQFAGHKKIDTTLKYYIKENQFTNDKLKENLTKISFSNAENPNKPINPDDI